jgi:hypothetical protein
MSAATAPAIEPTTTEAAVTTRAIHEHKPTIAYVEMVVRKREEKGNITKAQLAKYRLALLVKHGLPTTKRDAAAAEKAKALAKAEAKEASKLARREARKTEKAARDAVKAAALEAAAIADDEAGEADGQLDGDGEGETVEDAGEGEVDAVGTPSDEQSDWLADLRRQQHGG